MRKNSKDWRALAATLGLDTVRAGQNAGDRSLKRILNTAASTGCPARFLRLGGPRQFRAEIIQIVGPTPQVTTPAYRLLLDDRIPEIEFILTNPNCEAFLTRLDAEGKSITEIWRVKEQVLEFSRGLLRAGQQRAQRHFGPIRLAFHTTDLIWNLGIAEGQYVVARAYYKSATGHDEHVAEIYLRPLRADRPAARLAEALMAYYTSVKQDPRTDVIQTEAELATIGDWPSLFKGNAVLAVDDDAGAWIEKACPSETGDRAEQRVVACPLTDPCPWQYFNPVRLDRRVQRTSPWKGQTLRLRRVNGMMASDLLWRLQRLAETVPELRPKLETVAGALTYQAFQALREFREAAAGEPAPTPALRPYPWEAKLVDALREAGRFIHDSQRDLAGCIEDGRTLGRALVKQAKQPFRDAHLKNRLIVLDPDAPVEEGLAALVRWLPKAEPHAIFERLRQSTYDIDFETCLWTVTEWDDPLHILWSLPLPLSGRKTAQDSSRLFKPWWPVPAGALEQLNMWQTLLARSLREYCRRLWYGHVMPKTYLKRYQAEPRDLYLDLALAAARHVDGYTDLKTFLDKSKAQGDEVWNRVKATAGPAALAARYPEAAIRNFAYRPLSTGPDPEEAGLAGGAATAQALPEAPATAPAPSVNIIVQGDLKVKGDIVGRNKTTIKKTRRRKK
jgi:hypothetical protein